MGDHEHRVVGPEEILGTWRLLSYTAEDRQRGSRHFPLGPDADGFLMYTSDGYMSVHMMRRDRLSYELPDVGGGTIEQAANAAAGYLAYSGPFEIDSDGIVHHLVEVSLLPNWLRSVQLRKPHLQANHLTMDAEYPVGDTVIRSVLSWSRAEPHDPCGPSRP
jgi:hypothetical protein